MLCKCCVNGHVQSVGSPKECRNDQLNRLYILGHIRIAKHLLEHGADMNAVSATKNSSLIYASASGHKEVSVFLNKEKKSLALTSIAS